MLLFLIFIENKMPAYAFLTTFYTLGKDELVYVLWKRESEREKEREWEKEGDGASGREVREEIRRLTT